VVGYANAFAELGYTTAVLCDADDTALVTADLGHGITVFQTEEAMCTEQQVAQDLSPAGLREFALVGVANVERSRLEHKLSARGCAHDWLQALEEGGASEEQLVALRAALGSTAKNDGRDWFKSIDGGERLGAIVVAHAADDTHLQALVTRIMAWCCGD